jgi:membrane-bound lytic murein transglycosylase D
MKLTLALFFAAVIRVAAQTPEVPHKMQFADLTLTIRDDARREIQKDVDAFTKYPKSFNIKAERAKTYFPIIEKVFAEENVPDDFKYLVIQESALIPDAVSVSNAVGFWQFKDFTAVEMGLRVDKEIDERLNIVSSSRAAARYLKKNNGFFDNWLYALQSYQMGAGGVMKSEKDHKSGAKHMEITSHTYWYVKKFLAHKIAYEGAVKGAGQLQVLTYQNKNKKTLTELAKEVAVNEAELKSFNKWTKSGHIPDDRMYTVLIPVAGSTTVTLPETLPSAHTETIATTDRGTTAASARGESRKINGIATIKASAGENAAKLAARGNVDLSAFLKWNDISVSDAIQPGRYYLLGKKRTRATVAYHKVAPGEDLWSISQQHGVQLKKLKRYNRIESDRELKPGMTLWLSARKPKDSDGATVSTEVVQVDNESFSWAADPSETRTETATTLPVITPVVTPAEAIVKPAPEVVTLETEKGQDSTVVAQEPADSVKSLQGKEPVVEPLDSARQQTVEIIVAEKKKEHTVKAGETLYGIARQYNIAVMDLVNWNNLVIQDGIKPGQVLKLSENQSVAENVVVARESREITHEVRSTDTLYSIARKYGVTIKDLMEWNSKKDFTLSVGEKLRILQK